MKKIPLETVIAASALALGLALALAFTPPATWEAIGAFSEETWAGLALAGAGIIGAFFARPITSPASEPKKKLASSIRKDGENGSVSTEALVWLTLWGIAALVALARWVALRGGAGLLLAFLVLASGCGGAIQAQARAITVATVALEGVDRAVEAHARSRLAECEDEACVDATEAELMRALEPVTVAMASTRGVLQTWIEAFRIALVAGEDGDVLGALTTSAGRLVVEWGVLAGALGTAGLEVPAIPPLVLAVGGAL